MQLVGNDNSYHIRGTVNGAATVKNKVEVPQNIKIRKTTPFTYSTCVHPSKGTEIRILKRYLHDHVQCATIHNSQEREANSMCTDQRTDKEKMVLHTVGSSSVFKKKMKERNLPFATTERNLEDLMLSER